MIAANAALLAIVLGVVAAAILLSAVLAARRLRRASGRLKMLDTRLIDLANSLPGNLGHTRERLLEASAEIESGLWSLGRLDDRLRLANVRLSTSRAEVEQMRDKIAAARLNIERLKTTWRLVIRAIELRRTILG